MLEDAVAESVAADVGVCPAPGQRCGGPEVAAFFVTQVEGFPAGIAHWVVGPGSQAELVGILAPGVRTPALGDHRSEVRVRQHINPRRGCRLPFRGRDYVLAPIRREASKAIEEDQIARGRLGGCRGLGTAGPGRSQQRYRCFHNAPALDLVRQRSPAIGDDGARDRLDQNAVLVRYLVTRPYKDAAGPVR